MKEAVPNYYHKFKCLAGSCAHSCCVGWEIDIDSDTMAFYSNLQTEMGEKIRNHIAGTPPHFVLDENERCPFLNESGLCDIICTCGEAALCDICTLHPRFRNFYGSFVETGLGLCCEEAARIILEETAPFSLVMPKGIRFSAEEKQFFALRESVFNCLQDRTKTVFERFSALGTAFGFAFPFSFGALLEQYETLERLDESWTKMLQAVANFSFDEKNLDDEAFSVPLEQLAVYFVFRHLTDALYDGCYTERIRFAVMSCCFVAGLWSFARNASGMITLAEMANIVRMYSAEVEYSEENVEALLTSTS